jgi:phage shock protein PspC (stress-responsive transcriptional regulator)
MKKTLTVNLNGRVFNIDEDAYQLLDSYIKNLRIYFRNEEGGVEILADFEARIEELLSDRVRLGYNVINVEEVEKVITQMGRPGDFGGNEDNRNNADDAQKEADNEHYIHVKKKFYRNPNDKMFAGLCSGIAAYFDWNVAVVRIITAILIPITSVWIVPVYLIAWLVVPEARTAEQKLEMQGKPITVENIGKIVASGMEEINNTANRGGCLAMLVDFIVAFFKVCLVGLGCLVGIPLIFALVIVIIVLFATLFGVGTGILGGLIPWTNETFLFVEHPAIATSAFCLIIGIPLVTLVYTVISHLFHLKPVNKGVKWAGIIIWILALVALPFSGFKADWSKLHKVEWHINSFSDDIYGNGEISDRVELLSSVDELEVHGNLNINLQVEPSGAGRDSLVINGESNLLDKITVRQVAGKLILENEDHYNLHPTVPVLVRLQTSGLKDIEVHGAGHVDLANDLPADKFHIDVSGAGKLNLYDVHINQLNVEVSGAGEVHLSGTARKVNLDANGAAKVYAEELVSDTVYADVSGAGIIKCYPVDYLKGDASGAAYIVYKVEPKVKHSSVSGAGKIRLE